MNNLKDSCTVLMKIWPTSLKEHMLHWDTLLRVSGKLSLSHRKQKFTDFTSKDAIKKLYIKFKAIFSF